MKSNLKFFKKVRSLPVDQFFQNVLYDKKIGYYNSKQPLGLKGDFITSPKLSNLFSEMIAIWIISTWEIFGKPKKINLVELGPGDGSLTKTLLDVFKRFPIFNNSKKIYLFEISSFLKKIQKKNIKNNSVQWINDFKKIKNGPVIFFGNEFFDAIPIKQFKRDQGKLYEKYFFLGKNSQIVEKFKKASTEDVKILNSYRSLKDLKFIEFPKLGLNELKKIIKIINKLNGCLLIIDYGYLKPHNQSTLQSVIRHKRNILLNNLGKADVTSHVNFSILNEFFLKNKLKVKKVITQKKFLEKMGIMKRAEIIASKMKFNDQTNLYLRLKRLLNTNLMGELFKVILTYKFRRNKYFGFD